MGRENYRYIGQDDFRGGINQEPENAQPNQVLDALNVWCPNGVVEHRPSLRPVNCFLNNSVEQSSVTTITIIKEDNTTTTPSYTTPNQITGTYVAKTNTRTGDRFYIGFDDFASAGNIRSINHVYLTGAFVSSTSQLKCEYYSTAGWKYLPLIMDGSGLGGAEAPPTPYFTGTNSFHFCSPQDYSGLTVNSVAADLWLRFEVLNTNLVLGASISNIPVTVVVFPTKIKTQLAMTENKESIAIVSAATPTNAIGTPAARLFDNLQFDYSTTVNLNYYSIINSDFTTSSIVTIPQFDEIFVSFGYLNLSKKDMLAGLDNSQIESRPEFVGSIDGIKSDYHPDIIAQLDVWPAAKHLLYHQGTLFAANLLDGKQRIRWSAPEPAYRVWPSESFAELVGEDQSEVTGLAVLNENIIIFKRDSIWQLVDIGEDNLGLRQFSPRLIKYGIGCIAKESIRNIPGGLLFLSDSGVYFFNGTSDVKKISGPIDIYFNSLASKFSGSTATHWAKKNCYLLSIPTESNEENNITLVYDYKHNSWWVWSGFAVRKWFHTNTVNEAEEIYMLDYMNQFFQLEEVFREISFETPLLYSDLQVVPSYILSHRFGYGSNTTKLWGDITVDGNARMSCEAHILVQDEDPPASAVNLSFTDTSEDTWGGADQWGTAVWVKSKRRNRRLSYRKHGEWAQFRVENFGAGAQLKGVQLGYIPLGIR